MIKGPDSLVIMPTEEFLEKLKAFLSSVPLVAINETRSFTTDPVDRSGIVGFAGVGFDIEVIDLLPQAMVSITNEPDIFLNTNDPAIAAVIQTVFNGVDLDELVEEETPEDDSDLVLDF